MVADFVCEGRRVRSEKIDPTLIFFTISITFFLLVRSGISLGSGKTTSHDLQSFFHVVDSDGDGEIEHHEASEFMEKFIENDDDPASDGQTNSADEASMGELVKMHKLDFNFSYGGSTISSSELTDHLENMLSQDKVVEWIVHGVRLPQYAGAFKENAIDGLDFPALISEQGNALERDLGVSSLLHRHKIHKALVRQIFGIGRVPGPPRFLECSPDGYGAIQLQWDPPLYLGIPPVHKYVVQRRTRPSAWVEVGDPKDDAFLDKPDVISDTSYNYRVQAWGGHGPSEWAVIESCIPNPASVDRSQLRGEGNFMRLADPSQVVTDTTAAATAASAKASRPGDASPESTSELHVQFVIQKGSFNKTFWITLAIVGILVFVKYGYIPRLVWQLAVIAIQSLRRTFNITRTNPYIAVRILAIIFEAVAFSCHLAGSFCRKVRGVLNEHPARQDSSSSTGGISAGSLLSISENSSVGRKDLSEENLKAKPKRWPNGFSPSSELSGAELLAALTKTPYAEIEAVEHHDMVPESNVSTGSWDSNGRSRFSQGLEETRPAFSELRRSSTAVASGTPRYSDDMAGGAIERSRQTRSTSLQTRTLVTGSGGSFSLRGDKSSASGSERESDLEEDEQGEEEALRGGQNRRELSVGTSVTASAARGGRHRCNYESCKIRFDRWHIIADWRASTSKHYCRDCQGVYCVKHTRISPHGSRGQCGLDSKCLCYSCFARLPQDVQLKVERVNKLRAGPPVTITVAEHREDLSRSATRRPGLPPGGQSPRQLSPEHPLSSYSSAAIAPSHPSELALSPEGDALPVPDVPSLGRVGDGFEILGSVREDGVHEGEDMPDLATLALEQLAASQRPASSSRGFPTSIGIGEAMHRSQEDDELAAVAGLVRDSTGGFVYPHSSSLGSNIGRAEVRDNVALKNWKSAHFEQEREGRARPLQSWDSVDSLEQRVAEEVAQKRQASLSPLRQRLNNLGGRRRHLSKSPARQRTTTASAIGLGSHPDLKDLKG